MLKFPAGAAVAVRKLGDFTQPASTLALPTGDPGFTIFLTQEAGRHSKNA
jgi:hypothetical protein